MQRQKQMLHASDRNGSARALATFITNGKLSCPPLNHCDETRGNPNS